MTTALDDDGPIPTRGVWTAEAVALLGTDTDKAIAQQLGVSRAAVTQARKRRVIPTFRRPERLDERFTVLLSERDVATIREAATVAGDPDASTWARRVLRLAAAQRHPPAVACTVCGGLGELDDRGRTCPACAP